MIAEEEDEEGGRRGGEEVEETVIFEASVTFGGGLAIPAEKADSTDFESESGRFVTLEIAVSGGVALRAELVVDREELVEKLACREEVRFSPPALKPSSVLILFFSDITLPV